MKYLLLLTMIAVLVSCKKSSGDTTKPVIQLTSPMANQQFTAFSSVTISGTIADEGLINEVQVMVTNENTSAQVLNVQHTVGAKSYNVNEVFTVQAATTYKIHVEADDGAGNNTVVEMEVKGI
jgi:hypothetical protein